MSTTGIILAFLAIIVALTGLSFLFLFLYVKYVLDDEVEAERRDCQLYWDD